MQVKANKYQQEADLPLNKSEEAESKLIQKHEQSCDKGIVVNSAVVVVVEVAVLVVVVLVT